MNNTKFHPIFALVVLVALLLACSTTPTPAPAPTLVETETVAPTPTPEPTLTPEPTVETEAYRTELVQQIGFCHTSMLEWQELNRQGSESPDLLVDPDWLIRMANVLHNLNECADGLLKERDVPPAYMEANSEVREGALALLKFIESYGKGIVNLDPDSINLATQYMAEVGHHFERATELLPFE